MKVLLENLLRFEDGVTVTTEDLQAIIDWQQELASNWGMVFPSLPHVPDCCRVHGTAGQA